MGTLTEQGLETVQDQILLTQFTKDIIREQHDLWNMLTPAAKHAWHVRHEGRDQLLEPGMSPKDMLESKDVLQAVALGRVKTYKDNAASIALANTMENAARTAEAAKAANLANADNPARKPLSFPKQQDNKRVLREPAKTVRQSGHGPAILGPQVPSKQPGNVTDNSRPVLPVRNEAQNRTGQLTEWNYDQDDRLVTQDRVQTLMREVQQRQEEMYKLSLGLDPRFRAHIPRPMSPVEILEKEVEERQAELNRLAPDLKPRDRTQGPKQLRRPNSQYQPMLGQQEQVMTCPPQSYHAKACRCKYCQPQNIHGQSQQRSQTKPATQSYVDPQDYYKDSIQANLQPTPASTRREVFSKENLTKLFDPDMLANEESGWGTLEDLQDECRAIATVTNGIETRLVPHSRVGLGNLPAFVLPPLQRVGDENPSAIDWHRFKLALISRMSAQEVPEGIVLSELQSKNCLSPSLKKGILRCATLKEAIHHVNENTMPLTLGLQGITNKLFCKPEVRGGVSEMVGRLSYLCDILEDIVQVFPGHILMPPDVTTIICQLGKEAVLPAPLPKLLEEYRWEHLMNKKSTTLSLLGTLYEIKRSAETVLKHRQVHQHLIQPKTVSYQIQATTKPQSDRPHRTEREEKQKD